MVVCQFFLRGQCKFGESCRNEHPRDSERQSGFGNQSWSASRPANTNSQEKVIYAFTAESMSKDLTAQVDKPIWPISSYGPAKYEPTLLSGLDESPEELRVRATTAVANNALNDYLAYESSKTAAAEQVYANARSNISQAYEQATKQSVNNSATIVSAFSKPSAPTTFGQPSAFGALASTPPAPSAFSALGSAATATPAFGKPAFGQPTFGQSSFGQAAAAPMSAFGGQASSTAPTSAFGQTTTPAQSAFAQPQATSAFGQPSQPSSLIKPATGAFGSLATSSAPSAFGGDGGGGFSAFAGAPSAFGIAAAANTTTPQTGGSVFGQSSFGTPAAAPTSAFGTPAPASTFGTTSAFGNLSTTSAFSNPAPVSAFGTPAATSAFGGGASQGSVFGTPSAQQPVSVFGGGAPAAAPATQSSAFGPGGSGSAFGGGGTGEAGGAGWPQPISAIDSIAPRPHEVLGPPDFARAKAVYRPGRNAYDVQLPADYAAQLPKAALEAFKGAKFEWGKVPVWVPPVELR